MSLLLKLREQMEIDFLKSKTYEEINDMFNLLNGKLKIAEAEIRNLYSKLPNDIDLSELKKLLKFSNKYEISIQFWPKQIAVYIAKDGMDLIDFGGDFDYVIGKSIRYLNRINKVDGIND